MIVMSEPEYRNFKEALSMFAKLKSSFVRENGEEWEMGWFTKI